MDNKHPNSLLHGILSAPTLVSFAVAAIFIYFLTTQFNVDWSKTWANVLDMNIGFYLFSLVLYYSSFVFRGLRWKILTLNAGLNHLQNTTEPTLISFSQIVLMGWFVNAVAWLRLGDPYRAYAFSERSGAAFPWSLGTILAERVLDMITVFGLLVIGVAWFSITRDSEGVGRVLLAAFIMALILATTLWVMKTHGTRLSHLLPKRIESSYHRFEAGTVTSLKRLPILSILGIIGWILETGRLYFVTKSLDIDVVLPVVLVAALGHAILSTFPTPGGIGAVEPGTTGLLMLDMTQHNAVSVAIIDRSITFLSVIVFGGIAFLLWQFTHPKSDATQERALDPDTDTVPTDQTS